jgi:hypothetical protein
VLPAGAEDGRVGEGAVEPALGDVAVGGLREVDAVPAPVVGRVLARVSPRLAALGRQVEVVLAHARRSAARTRRLPQESCPQKQKHQPCMDACSAAVESIQRTHPTSRRGARTASPACSSRRRRCARRGAGPGAG